MFDNLRESASSSFYEEDSSDGKKETNSSPVSSFSKRRSSRFLGMTAQQRFVISLMLLFTVCVIGTLAMFVMGKMSFF